MPINDTQSSVVFDPIAQTFTVNPNYFPNGIVLHSVRLCFATKDEIKLWISVSDGKSNLLGYFHFNSISILPGPCLKASLSLLKLNISTISCLNGSMYFLPYFLPCFCVLAQPSGNQQYCSFLIQKSFVD